MALLTKSGKLFMAETSYREPMVGILLLSESNPPYMALRSAATRRRWPPSRDRWFESISLQRGVRCELDLGEGGFADEIAAAPLGVLLKIEWAEPSCWLL